MIIGLLHIIARYAYYLRADRVNVIKCLIATRERPLKYVYVRRRFETEQKNHLKIYTRSFLLL